MRAFSTLMRRHLARLSADRVTLIVVALASVAGILGAVITAMHVSNAPGGSGDLGARGLGMHGS